MNNKGDQKTTDLITSLSEDLSAVKPLVHPVKRVLAWTAFAIAYVTLAVGILGMRIDINTKIHDPVYLYELINIMALAVSAAICSAWLCVPDMRGQKWLIAVPITLFASFTVWVLLKTALEHYNFPRMYWHHCHMNALIFGFIPAVTIWFMAVTGRTTHPILMSVMNVLAVGGLAYFALRLTCMSDDIGHLCAYHLLPYILFGFIGSVLGRIIYRW